MDISLLSMIIALQLNGLHPNRKQHFSFSSTSVEEGYQGSCASATSAFCCQVWAGCCCESHLWWSGSIPECCSVFNTTKHAIIWANHGEKIESTALCKFLINAEIISSWFHFRLRLHVYRRFGASAWRAHVFFSLKSQLAARWDAT